MFPRRAGLPSGDEGIDAALANNGCAEAFKSAPAKSGECRKPSAGKPGAHCHCGRNSESSGESASPEGPAMAVTSDNAAGKLAEPAVTQPVVARTVIPCAA